MAANRLVFRVHAIRRMFERQIGVNDVRQVLATGEVVEDYPNDLPYPSRLVLGWTGKRPIHVVAAITAVPMRPLLSPFMSRTPTSGSPTSRRGKRKGTRR